MRFRPAEGSISKSKQIVSTRRVAGAVLKIRQATPEPVHREIYATLGISADIIKPLRTWHEA